MPLHTRRRVIEAVLNEILGLHNKPKAAVHSVHKLTGHKKKKKKTHGTLTEISLSIYKQTESFSDPLAQ